MEKHGGATRARRHGSIADSHAMRVGAWEAKWLPHPPAPCSYLAVMEGVDGASGDARGRGW
jgi:hypothetical protein